MKYDILTVMGSYALSQSKGQQKLILRFVTLITARYNWRRDELAVGQREIARLWHVDERTVKREMAKLRAMSWIKVKRQGVRGRVGEYGVDVERILEDTSAVWAAVGPDFEYRLKETDKLPENIVPLNSVKIPPPPDLENGSTWNLVQALLYQEDPSLFASWYQALIQVEQSNSQLTLTAPSRFHATYVQANLKARIVAACREIDEMITDVVITT
ncbi:hypothetical protein RSK20926_01412 [Roseobacter sp. SK209-2-6]|nr:hypothetical protein RSK20926_01412 [Roseobacter sp. SK209-2-6]